MLIALASPRVATSLDDGLAKIRRMQTAAAERGAKIVCFPEAYLPGLRGQDFEVFPFTPTDHERALDAVSRSARELGIATILSVERFVSPNAAREVISRNELSTMGRQIAAYVIASSGELLGVQTKNQLDPSEDRFYLPGEGRQVFEIPGLKFGIAICHEGWRYPETVRWAAVRGTQVVFHPQHTGYEQAGPTLTEWGSRGGPYYEQAMLMRSRENTIYFASVNYALRYPESATSIISPAGECVAYLPYGEAGVLVHELDLTLATGLLARRLAPERF